MSMKNIMLVAISYVNRYYAVSAYDDRDIEWACSSLAREVLYVVNIEMSTTHGYKGLIT